jgi:hypothetical protein
VLPRMKSWIRRADTVRERQDCDPAVVSLTEQRQIVDPGGSVDLAPAAAVVLAHPSTLSRADLEHLFPVD